ncbi:hypothetical protein O181_030031 [Austropuccinia psidii MF-1]|uniref:Uncharacterized protein n=1 Tax=Austropuccinia psidii MF-1 TaxID=1389203 RepID=A0A9Q3H3V6_9BASI|nr:hypothetical protein [Austropuccinia psidii MF-1]
MTPTRSERNYYIQSNGYGPGNSSHKLKIQEFQPSREAQMEDSRTSTNFQRLARTFYTIIESLEAEITVITVLKELRIQAQNLENSTGQNADLFQEQLEKSDKERLELKEDIQSIINNISLKNEFPRQSTPILDRNVLSLNNDLHHTISRNAEFKTVCNFKAIPRLEKWPSFSCEGEYNHMEFMKTIAIFKEKLNILDKYISARLHSIFTNSEKKWYYKMRQDHGKHSWPW